MLKEETLTEKLVKKWFWLYFFTFLIMPLGYFVRLIISNDLSVAEVWIIYSIIWLMAFLSNYNDLWFTESLNYFLPKFWIQKKFDAFKTSVFIALLLQTITAVLIWFFLYYFSWWLALHYFHHIEAQIALKIFSFFFIFFNIFKFLTTVFTVFQDVFWARFLDFLRMFLILIFTIIIYFKDIGDVYTYSLAWFLWSLVVTIIWLLIFLKKYFFVLKEWKIVFDKNLIKQLFVFAITVLITTQWALILWNIDQQMVIYFIWPQEAWYYTTFFSLLSIYSFFISPFTSFLFPLVSELNARSQKWKLDLLIAFSYKYLITLGIWIWLMFLTLWPIIAFILFGKKFLYSWYLLSLASLTVIILIWNNINFNVMSWLGLVKEKNKIIWFTAFVDIVLNLILIPKIGLIGALISTVVCWILMFIFSSKYVWVFGKISKDQFLFWFKNLIWALLFFGIVYFFKEDIFILENWKRLIDIRHFLFVAIIWTMWFVLINLREFLLLKEKILEVVFTKKWE